MLINRVQTVLMTGALALMVPAPGALGQEADQPPVYGGVHIQVRGVFVTPVPGAPLTATVLIESKRPLADGTVEVKRTINNIARDSVGRIHNERRRLEPETFHGTPLLTEVHIYDPQTRASIFYVPYSYVARQTILPEPPRNPGPATQSARRLSPDVKEEDLGNTTLDGITAKGLRRTRTIDAKVSGTGQPVEVVDEYWYSEELHLNLLVHHSDPRTGEQSVAVSDIKRVEPDAALFQVPEGFKTVDLTPPAVR
jgi:hypothetical protein